MKKYLLLILVMFMSTASVFAQDWMPLETKAGNVSLEIDKDSIEFINDYTCVYALRLQRYRELPKAVFVKANFKDSKMGIIEVEEYNELSYNPRKIFINPEAFLKPLDQNSLLKLAYDYTNSIYVEKNKAKALQTEITPKNLCRSDYKAKNTQEYINIITKELYKNWNPPKSARNSSAIIIINIARDGSLQNYVFAQKSQDETNNRAIMAAVEKTVPYGIFPDDIKFDRVDLQFLFEYKKFRKYVK